MNNPSDNLKMLLIGVLALSVLVFLLPDPVGAKDYTDHLEDISVHLNSDGYLYTEATVIQDFSFYYDEDTYDDFGSWTRNDGMNTFFWASSAFDTLIHGGYVYPIYDEEMKTGTPPYTKTYKAGNTYKFYPIKDNACLDIDGKTDYTSCRVHKNDSGFDGYTIDNNSWVMVENYTTDDQASGQLFEALPLASVDFPASGSELDAPIDLKLDYENGAGYAYAIFYMEQENQDGDPIYSYQALEPIATSTATGTVDFKLPESETEELAKGYYNDCVCLLQKYDGTKTRNLCPDYEVTVLTGSRVSLPAPDWEEISTSTAEDFYEQHSDYATATPAFDVIFESIEPFYGWTNSIAEQFAGQFNPNKARERGREMGDAVVKARAYAGSLNAFFGGLPVAWILLFYVITALALTVFKLIYRLVDLIKP